MTVHVAPRESKRLFYESIVPDAPSGPSWTIGPAVHGTASLTTSRLIQPRLTRTTRNVAVVDLFPRELFARVSPRYLIEAAGIQIRLALIARRPINYPRRGIVPVPNDIFVEREEKTTIETPRSLGLDFLVFSPARKLATSVDRRDHNYEPILNRFNLRTAETDGPRPSPRSY